MITVNLSKLDLYKLFTMKIVIKLTSTLLVLLAVLLVSCGGGGGGGGAASGGSASKSYSLAAQSIPISSTDNLVSVTVTGTQFSAVGGVLNFV